MTISEKALTAAILVLAQHNVAPDIQGMLINGNDKNRIKPGALRAALQAALATPAPEPIWSFDDTVIGRMRHGGSSITERIIRRPTGLSSDQWYSHASAVIQQLNATSPVAALAADRDSVLEEAIAAIQAKTIPGERLPTYEVIDTIRSMKGKL